MGSCLFKDPQEPQSAQQHPMEEFHSYAEGQPIFKGKLQSYNGIVSDKQSGSGFDVGQLATSSLLGLLATVKERITKPTAMAQGRVAHLIEWKSWGGGASRGGWGSWAGVQQDEQLYSHLTDEIKEARFAAGVAEQFALAEAAITAWSTQRAENLTNTIPLPDPELYLSQLLLDGDSLYGTHVEAGDEIGSLIPSHTSQSRSCSTVDTLRLEQRISPCVCHADSISLSEDEVFYN